MPNTVYITTSGEYIVKVAVCLRNYMILGNKQGKSGKVRNKMIRFWLAKELAEVLFGLIIVGVVILIAFIANGKGK